MDLRHLVSKNPELTFRASYVAALPIVAGTIGATMQYLMTGKGPEELKDYFFPKTGGLDEHGIPERVSIPSYMKDVYHYTQEPGRTAANKLHPMLNLMAEMLQNREYYGTTIRNEDDPLVQQAIALAQHAGKSVVPFAIRGAAREHALGGSIAKQAANFVGLSPAPTSLNKTPAEKSAQEYASQHTPKGARTTQEAARSEARSKIVRSMRLGQDPSALIAEAVNSGLMTRREVPELRKAAQRTPLQRSVANLSTEEALAVFEKASATERRRIGPEVAKKVHNAAKEPWKWDDTARDRARQFFGINIPRVSPRLSAPVR